MTIRLDQCTICPRLAKHIQTLREDHPDWYNRPVPALGDPTASILIIGLAPGARGANRTGKAFSGDRSGQFLWAALERTGLADPLMVRITNAVKCVPPANRPTAAEIHACSDRWLTVEINNDAVRVLLALGTIAHTAVLDTLGVPRRAHPFRHGAEYRLDRHTLIDAYHPSPLNTQTGRLSADMFDAVLHNARAMADLRSHTEPR